ncbi:GNAT family N-acetyltransferase [Streptomyces sp. 3MP-14]|uniref:GNAT family N-acetyltransferase n=1 Tax=Streptomyces mimosae TaxID=2586635 RepID=A0A5N6ANR6_9ACTN|nr:MULTISPECIES: GNAT family N-acetyltransferase [Streptomyces]KAB8169733.1 GNAT family N-acetyltransferase [Streptomyces mimosae]KAB8178481.1 GNAT family N-acetyltransferase [Streptomyces sp. 3MP-14]
MTSPSPPSPLSPPSPPSSDELTVAPALLSDPLVRPLLRGLAHEYTARYGSAANELSRYPAAEFAPPHGLLLLLLHDGAAVAGGAYRRLDEHTAELKRIWTHPAHRRRGLARRVVAELERAAADRGYRRVWLTTGPRQPEAKYLYLNAGYAPLFDLAADPETLRLLPFEKRLPPPAATTAAPRT